MKSMVQQASRWFVEDRDGGTFLVTNHLDDPLLVEWDEVAGGWTCSSCGTFIASHSAAKVTCAHVMAAGRRLPLTVALGMIPQVANKGRQTSAAEGSKPLGRRAELRGIAASLSAGSVKRAEVARKHDERHAAVTSEVTVRQATDEDRARLAERRRRKRIGD
jgi:hypothetical protein